MFKSVRLRITVWYALTLSVTLSLFSVLVYNNLEKTLYENMDRLLEFRAEGVADAVEAYLETEEIETGRVPKASAKSGTFFMVTQNLVNGPAYDPKLAAIEVKITDARGVILASSPGAASAPEIPEGTLNEAVRGEAAYDTIKAADSRDKESVYRSYTTPVLKEGKTVYLVQASRPLYQTEFALNNLRDMMAVLVPMIVLFTGAAGMLFARVALKPVHGMIKTIRQISAENLSLRIPATGAKDEIRELASMFNDMLSRLEGSFLSQKRFIQDASHELKTPLTILKGELEVALKKARSSQEYASILQSNLEETNRISKLVENLLTLAKFDNREIPLDISAVNLNRVLESLASDMAQVAGKKRINLALKLEPGLPVIKADAGQLRRAFLNILDNAVKYGEEGGTVTISSAGNAAGVLLVFSDSGRGIAPKDLPHVFERFYRADSSRSTEGFGLGLAITKSILDAHGAAITVKSGPARGASFSVFFATENV